MLVSNRLTHPLPIVDEVLHIDRIPLGMLAAIEVAVPERSLKRFLTPTALQLSLASMPMRLKTLFRWHGR